MAQFLVTRTARGNGLFGLFVVLEAKNKTDALRTAKQMLSDDFGDSPDARRYYKAPKVSEFQDGIVYHC